LAALPIATLIAIVNADPLWGLVIETGERIHFQAMRQSYLKDIEVAIGG
jgi:hypothetical protein